MSGVCPAVSFLSTQPTVGHVFTQQWKYENTYKEN